MQRLFNQVGKRLRKADNAFISNLIYHPALVTASMKLEISDDPLLDWRESMENFVYNFSNATIIWYDPPQPLRQPNSIGCIVIWVFAREVRQWAVIQPNLMVDGEQRRNFTRYRLLVGRWHWMKPQSNEGFVVSLDLVQKFGRESSLVFGTINEAVMRGAQENEILIVIPLLRRLRCVMAVCAGLIAADMRHLA